MPSLSVLFSFYCLLLLVHTKDTIQTTRPAEEFRRHRVVAATLQHARSRRDLRTTRQQDGLHSAEVTATLAAGDERYVLDLRLNTELLPRGHTLAYSAGGRRRVRRAVDPHHTQESRETELCQYRGGVRGARGSWAALSTCRGLRGVLYDGQQLLYVEPAGGDMSSPHYLYRHEELTATAAPACGFRPPADNDTRHQHDAPQDRLHRSKRATVPYELRAPYNANGQSRYVELALVLDHAGYRAAGGDLAALHAECKDIANIINAVYAPLNIFIALVHVEVWSESDQIHLLSKGDDTLTNFLTYRRTELLRHHHNDNAQLLTRQRFDNGVVGKALKGTMCTYEYSGGINTNHSGVVGLVATTIAHEMGHNFGMEHDNEADCECPEKKCIMAPSSNDVSPVHWSSCSQEALALSFEHGLDYCLRNKPVRLFDMPTCGNGLLEEGEQCDCGPAPGACAACCHADTCMLRRNATCATGACCDLATCGVRAAGSECRAVARECDLPEYCTGNSEFCPEDVHKMDSLPCDKGQAYCAGGSCRSHSDQCQLLWGPSGAQAHDRCYAMNRNGSQYGNCGYDRLHKTYARCEPEDAPCGMLHCRHLNEQLEFGVESVATQSHTFININGSILPCRTALVDLGLEQVDPGLVPDGAKCGHDKMCEKQRCVSVESVRARLSDSVCPSDCSGRGVCNSKGQCHCERGFAPPLCALPGPGGSHASGPAADPSVRHKFMVAMYVVFLCVVPAALLLLLLAFYSRHSVLASWRRRPRKPSASPGKGSLQRRLSRGASRFAASLQGAPQAPHASPAAPAAPATPDDNMSSSLLRSDSDGGAGGNINPVNFFGHFKGFSLTPLERSQVSGGGGGGGSGGGGGKSANIVPIHRNNGSQNAVGAGGKAPPARAAPPVPAVPTVPAGQRSSPRLDLGRSGSSVQSRIKALMGADRHDDPPTFPGGDPAPRPTISSPILEASTCTAKELISPLQGSKTLGPVRAAPGVPGASQDLPRRPLSMETDVFLKPLPDEPPPRKPKEGSSLNRFASFLKQERPRDKTRSPLERSHSLPKNPDGRAKVVGSGDRSALRNLQISNPILLKDIALPASAVPVGRSGEEPDGPVAAVAVARARSMRAPAGAPRPDIPSFGSMRAAGGAPRPLSAALGGRPTSPPPPRPDMRRAAAAVPAAAAPPEYVDCVGEKLAPLANIHEESPGDNIYAVIEENPPAGPAGGAAGARAPPGGSNSGSTESVGLLGEIVGEIQTRNLDSIYSSSTLARRRRERERRPAGAADTDADYVNSASSTTSSGYLQPSALRPPASPPLRGPHSKIPTLGRQVTPPGLRSVSSPRSSAPAPAAANSPDVVSSCAASANLKTGKSPDVVNGNGNNTVTADSNLKSSVRAGGAVKTTEKPPPKPVPFAEKKNVPPKVNPTKPVGAAGAANALLKAQTDRSNLTKATPRADASKSLADSLNKNKPKPVPKPTALVQRSESGAGRGASRASNVASLQQKFENRKSVGRDLHAKK